MIKSRLLLYAWCAVISLLAFTCSREYPSTAPYVAPVQPTNPGSLPPQTQPTPAQKRLFLANDKVRIGIDLNMGGAINYLAEAGTSVNMINNNDLGRQLQTSLYAGPYPYSVNGKNPVEQWKYLGWNPVQTGDFYNNPAQVISYQQTDNQLYVKTIPLIWPLLNEPADCVMEHWLELRDNTVHVRSRTTVNRRDTAYYEARTQETPCVYVNSPWYRMVLYTGMQPFTNSPVSEYTDQNIVTRYATENWVALLNKEGRGVGLYRSGEFRYRTAGFGQPGVGGEFDVTSTYANSDSYIQIDHNGVYEFDYTLILGSVADIRQFAYAQPRPAAAPNFRFTQDRQGWYYSNVRDKGWPINNELAIYWQRADTTRSDFRVASPMVYWQASDVPTIYIQGAFTTKATSIRLTWRKPEDPDFYGIDTRYADVPITGDGQFRTYAVNMAGRPGWDGVITQIGLNSSVEQRQYEKGSTARIRSITATRP